MRTDARFLVRLFVGAFAACIGVIAVINFLVDPYGYFGTPTVRGLTASKPKAFEHDRFFKTGLARRIDADCLLAGSSRIGEGIPPNHPSLTQCRQVLDVSMAGPNVGEMTSIVSIATGQHPMSMIVLSLDFFAFNAVRGDTRGGSPTVFSPGLMPRIRTAAAVLLSTDVAKDSLHTLGQQSVATFYEPDGSVNQQQLADEAARRPTRRIFLRGMRGYIFHILGSAPSYDFKLNTVDSGPLQQLAAFIREQHRQGTRLVMFFSPAHAWQWELIDALGLWPLWEQWKREVVRINESSENLLGQQPFALWDFAGYRGPALEDVPLDNGAISALEHYWDASHFNQRLGAMMLNQMLSAKPPIDEFGWILSGVNVDTTLQRNRSDRAAWRALFPKDVEDVRSVVGCFAPYAVQTRLHLLALSDEFCQRLTVRTR